MPRFSLEDIENARPESLERLAGTTEEEIQHQITEDGSSDMGEVNPSRLTTPIMTGCQQQWGQRVMDWPEALAEIPHSALPASFSSAGTFGGRPRMGGSTRRPRARSTC
jgi:hypothetical protein